jgi:putative hydrolase of the HAD superfamily
MSLRALLFDYGGTLDAPGVPWVERFLEIYAAEGLDETEDRIRAAFGHATRCAYADEGIRDFGLAQTVVFHIDRQLEFLGRRAPRLAAAAGARFLHAARADLDYSRAVLQRLQHRCTLGVISNFYGNVNILLEEAGIAPLLSTIVDSTRVGVSKPDPAIFRIALDKIGCAAQEAMYVGDSFEKDVAGARGAGMRAGWLVGKSERVCSQPALVDVRLRDLAELEKYLE